MLIVPLRFPSLWSTKNSVSTPWSLLEEEEEEEEEEDEPPTMEIERLPDGTFKLASITKRNTYCDVHVVF